MEAELQNAGEMAEQIAARFLTQNECNSRLNFLYQAVQDTQNTIRFIDTKAAFCVTLLSAMVAGNLQIRRPAEALLLQRLFTWTFLFGVGFCLLVCLRVIFPVIKPQGPSDGKPAPRPIASGPRFFIGQNKKVHWLKHTFSNRVGNILSDNQTSYMECMEQVTDTELMASMVEELLMVSTIRQLKSDRLHVAMLLIMVLVPLFLLSILV